MRFRSDIPFEVKDRLITDEAGALLDALNDYVDGCKCSDERALCLACLEHCAAKVREVACMTTGKERG